MPSAAADFEDAIARCGGGHPGDAPQTTTLRIANQDTGPRVVGVNVVLAGQSVVAGFHVPDGCGWSWVRVLPAELGADMAGTPGPPAGDCEPISSESA